MASKDLPLNGPPLAQGLDYNRLEDRAPETDDAKIPRGIAQAGITSSHNPFDSGIEREHLSLATKEVDAPAFGTNLPTDRHPDNWLDRSKPHVSPEPQGPRARSTTARVRPTK